MTEPRVRLRDRTPLPLLVYRQLRAEITAGTHAPGSRLPSEAELAAAFGVSRVTTREALRMLQRDGLVASHQGRGHFVLGGALIREPITELRSVSELLGSLGYTVDTTVLEEKRLPAGELAQSLQVDAAEPLVRVVRLRSSSGEPLICSVDNVPARLLGDDAAGYEGSLVDALARGGHELAYSHARITAAELPSALRRHVGAAGRRPWLLLDQVNFAPDGMPLIVSRDYHRGDRFEFDVVRRRLG